MNQIILIWFWLGTFEQQVFWLSVVRRDYSLIIGKLSMFFFYFGLLYHYSYYGFKSILPPVNTGKHYTQGHTLVVA